MTTLLIGIVIGMAITIKFDAKVKALFKPFRFKRIVKFEDDKYAVRWGICGLYSYKDLTCHNFWWANSNRNFKDCLGALEECKNQFGSSNSGTPID